MSDIVTSSQSGPGDLIPFKKEEQTFYGEKINSEIQLTKDEVRLIEGINYLKIIEIDHPKMLESIYSLVAKNLIALSSNKKAEDIAFLANQLTDELMLDYSNLTIKEVDTIIHDGIRGVYDTEERYTVGLSVVNFNLWAREFSERKLNLNLAIKKKVDQFLIPETTMRPVTKAALINIIRQEYIAHQKVYNLLDTHEKNQISWDRYWVKKGLITSSNYVYEQLAKFKLIKKVLVETEMKKFKDAGIDKLSIQLINLRMDAERIVCCNYALKLRNEALKKTKNNENPKG